jgi:DNA polymerase III subunit delta'
VTTSREPDEPGPAIAADEPVPHWCERAWSVIAARAASGTLPHALLLCGPAGLGKRAFAESFVGARLCRQPHEGRACGACRACRLLAAGTHPDRLRVTLEVNQKTGNPRKDIVVEQIRELSARLAMASQFGGWQVAVIDPADALNFAAQNALLKTLEEPTSASLIVLVADRPWRLQATVRSRCQRVEFTLPARDEAAAWLRGRGADHVDALLDAAAGNPGEAWLLARDGGLQRRDAVARDLLALAGGRARARDVAADWAGDEPDVRLTHAARLLDDTLKARARGTRAAFDPGWSADVLADGFDRCGRLREALRGPLRNDLALFEWLATLPRQG